MPPTRLLPPQFLLPAWNARQLAQIAQRAYLSSSSPNTQKSQRALKSRQAAPEREEDKPSLFEELFPEEAETLKKKEAEERLDKLPAFEWDGDPHLGFGPPPDGSLKDRRSSKRKGEQFQSGWWRHVPLQPSPKTKTVKTQQTPERPQDSERRRRETSVLVLNAASKTLEESDFFRLSPKGEHIEGWTSGIIKVIPGRDTRSLARLSHYFILFTSSAAARAYLDQTIRLHKLSRSHSTSTLSSLSSLPPPPGYLQQGEDLHSILRGFSLVPGYGKLSLRMLNRPYKPNVLRMIDEGGPAATFGRQSSAEDRVLLSVDMGSLTIHDLADTVSADGKKRNLHWKLAGGGNDIVRLNIEPLVEDETTKEAGLEDGCRSKKKYVYRGPAKYVISFKDRHEARTFVREWHRRPLPVRREHSLGDERPPIINAEILW